MTNNELKVILEKHITDAIDEITSQDNELGWIGGDLSSLATDAAFAVIMASASGSNAAEEAVKD
jgi:hypothetical protein